MTPAPRPSKIVCVGRNYGAHAAELGSLVPEEPLLFLKPPSALIGPGDAIRLPPGAGAVHYEGEIALRIGHRASNVEEGEALAFVDAVLPLNDVTARELQRADDQWTRAKGFDTFCPVGEAVPLADATAAAGEDLRGLEVVTRVDGEERQRGQAAEMVFGFAFLVAYVSGIMTLEPGDLLATGTPEGVGPLAAGDRVEVDLPGLSRLANPVEEGR